MERPAEKRGLGSRMVGREWVGEAIGVQTEIPVWDSELLKAFFLWEKLTVTSIKS